MAFWLVDKLFQDFRRFLGSPVYETLAPPTAKKAKLLNPGCKNHNFLLIALSGLGLSVFILSNKPSAASSHPPKMLIWMKDSRQRTTLKVFAELCNYKMLRYQNFYHTNDNWRRSSLRSLRLCQRSKAAPSLKFETGEKCYEAGSRLDNKKKKAWGAAVVWRREHKTSACLYFVILWSSLLSLEKLFGPQGHSNLNVNEQKKK